MQAVMVGAQRCRALASASTMSMRHYDLPPDHDAVPPSHTCASLSVTWVPCRWCSPQGRCCTSHHSGGPSMQQSGASPAPCCTCSCRHASRIGQLQPPYKRFELTPLLCLLDLMRLPWPYPWPYSWPWPYPWPWQAALDVAADVAYDSAAAAREAGGAAPTDRGDTAARLDRLLQQLECSPAAAETQTVLGELLQLAEGQVWMY